MLVERVPLISMAIKTKSDLGLSPELYKKSIYSYIKGFGFAHDKTNAIPSNMGTFWRHTFDFSIFRKWQSVYH